MGKLPVNPYFSRYSCCFWAKLKEDYKAVSQKWWFTNLNARGLSFTPNPQLSINLGDGDCEAPSFDGCFVSLDTVRGEAVSTFCGSKWELAVVWVGGGWALSAIFGGLDECTCWVLFDDESICGPPTSFEGDFSSSCSLKSANFATSSSSSQVTIIGWPTEICSVPSGTRILAKNISSCASKSTT